MVCEKTFKFAETKEVPKKWPYLPQIFQRNKRTMMVLYRSPEHICNLYGLSRAGY